MTGEKRKRRRWLLIAAFGVALAATLFFAVKVTLTAAHWGPGIDDRPLQPWMTPRYVAHARHVPPEVIGEALGLDPRQPPRRMTLAELAAMRGVSVAEVIAVLEQAVDAHREAAR